MKVYIMNVSGINPNDKGWYKYLSENRKKKVDHLKQTEKKAQSIGAELLLNYAVNGDMKIPVKWETDGNGKLYLTEHKDKYVNLSHSKDYAVLAIHDKPIGIDIQYCRECDMKIADRFFTKEESDVIRSSSNLEKTFFEIWTKKESLVKAVGCALTVPLSSFSVLGSKAEYNGEIYRFREYSVKGAGYKLFVCFLA